MGTYRVPRNTKGESRILMIFSTKALIYTVVGVIIGYIFDYALNLIGLGTIGLIVMAIFGVIGFALGTLKIPEIGAMPITKEVAGEKLDEIIIRYFKFKQNKQKIYIDKKTKEKEEEKKNG